MENTNKTDIKSIKAILPTMKLNRNISTVAALATTTLVIPALAFKNIDLTNTVLMTGVIDFCIVNSYFCNKLINIGEQKIKTFEKKA